MNSLRQKQEKDKLHCPVMWTTFVKERVQHICKGVLVTSGVFTGKLVHSDFKGQLITFQALLKVWATGIF